MMLALNLNVLLGALLSLLAQSVPLAGAESETPLHPRSGPGVRVNVNTTILSDSKVSMAWYAGWHSTDLPLSSVSWAKYTHLAYAFGVTSPNPTEITLAESDEQLLPQFVKMAHENNVKATLSIGGWTGSRFFSTNVGSAQNRSAFVKTLVDVVKKYDLDGLDFDWEYPDRQGIGCNTLSKNDTSNFLSFLQQLRQDSTGAQIILSAATSIQPWNDSTTGTPSTNNTLSGFADVLDFITIMNYNIWGPSSASAGPNAPLNDTCAAQGGRGGSAVGAVEAWVEAGIPPNKILLGVPMFGQSFVISKNRAFSSESQSGGSGSTPPTLASFPKFENGTNHVRKGDKWDSEGGTDICGNSVGPAGTYSFWGLVSAGYLRSDGSGREGMGGKFDGCSQTPYMYDEQTQTFISYDNADSFAAKGDFIKSTGLRGFAIWEAAGDYNDTLLDSILLSTANGNANKQSGSNGNGTPTATPGSITKGNSADRLSATSARGVMVLSLVVLVVLDFVGC